MPARVRSLRLVGVALAAALSLASGSVTAPSSVRIGPDPAGDGGPVSRISVARNASVEIVGLGDSVPAGTACDCDSYVALVGAELVRDRADDVVVRNDSIAGYTTWDLLDDLADPDVRAELARADLVIVTIGANDLSADLTGDPACIADDERGCAPDALDEVAGRLTQVIHGVRALQPAGSALVVTGYWNVLLDGEVGRELGPDYVAASDTLTRAFNARAELVATGAGATYLDVYAMFKGADGEVDPTRWLASDGDHPNAEGHALIASALEVALGVGPPPEGPLAVR